MLSFAVILKLFGEGTYPLLPTNLCSPVDGAGLGAVRAEAVLDLVDLDDSAPGGDEGNRGEEREHPHGQLLGSDWQHATGAAFIDLKLK